MLHNCFNIWNGQIVHLNSRFKQGGTIKASRRQFITSLVCSRTGQYDWPIVPDELHVMSLVTLLDAVHTDGVAVCCVTGVTPAGNPNCSCKHTTKEAHSWGYSGHRHCECKHELPVKIVHWVAGVTWNLVQALTSAHSLFNGILIVHDFIIWRRDGRKCINGKWMVCRENAELCEQESTFHCNVDTRCKKQSPEAIVEDLISLKGRCGMIGDLNTL